MKKKWLISFVFLAIALTPASAHARGTWWKIEGTIAKSSAPGTIPPSGLTEVYLCTNSQSPLTTGCNSTVVDSNGKFAFYNVSVPDEKKSRFYLFAFSATGNGEWGSREASVYDFSACEYVDTFGNCTVTGSKTVYISTKWINPRPLVPTGVSPLNGATIPTTNVTLMWRDGLDVYRKYSAWPITYDIYTSENYGTERLSAFNLTCNRTDGKCSTLVAGPLAPGTRYTWRVVAKLWFDTSRTKNYSTSSPTYSVTTQGPPPTPKYGFRAYYGQYLSATNGGGSDVTATAWSLGPYETFRIVDINGGDLRSGDQVNLVASNGMYLVAEGGGGGVVNANRTAAGPWETFTIESPDVGLGQIISNGDGVAFSSYYGTWVVAEGGGGGEVLCNRYAVGPWETFTLVEVW